MQGVVEAVFLLFHLDLRSGANIDDCHAAGQLGEAFLELLAVVAERKIWLFQIIVVFLQSISNGIITNTIANEA